MTSSRTRSLATLAVLASLVGGAAPAGAARNARVVELRYTAPSPMVEGLGGICASNCAGAFADRGEKTLLVEVVDDHSPFVLVRVYQDFDGDGLSDQRDEKCMGPGEELKLKTKPFARIGVHAETITPSFNNPSPNQACPGAATTGVIRLTFVR